MDYSKFENWKSSHATEMQDLSLASPSDLFIFTRFTNYAPLCFEGKQVVFAQTLGEAIGYIRHIFLGDTLNDAVDDLKMEFNNSVNERQKDAILLSIFWFKAGNILFEKDIAKLRAFCKEFNEVFQGCQSTEYQIEVFNGADELKAFLIENYSDFQEFDQEYLCKICNRDHFCGEALNEFLNEFFQ